MQMDKSRFNANLQNKKWCHFLYRSDLNFLLLPRRNTTLVLKGIHHKWDHGVEKATSRPRNSLRIRRCIQKFPYWGR